MNPAFLTLGIVVLAVPIMFVNILMPTFNIHMAANREAVLRELVQATVDDNRFNPAQIDTALDDINVDGIVVTNSTVASSGQYVVVDLTYRFSNLFTNQFFTREDDLDVRTKNMRIVIDRVI